MVQWLGLHALIAKGVGSIPAWGTKIPQVLWHSQKKKKERKVLHVSDHLSDATYCKTLKEKKHILEKEEYPLPSYN